MVPRDHLLDLLDDLRESLPEDVQRGRRDRRAAHRDPPAGPGGGRAAHRPYPRGERPAARLGPAQREEIAGHRPPPARRAARRRPQVDADEMPIAWSPRHAGASACSPRRAASATGSSPPRQAEHERLVTETEVYRTAVARADELGAQTAAEVARMRAEVDEYVDTRLADFGTTLERMLRSVEKARDRAARP